MTLTQQVDADQHVELAQAQVADDLHALDGVDVRVRFQLRYVEKKELLKEEKQQLLLSLTIRLNDP